MTDQEKVILANGGVQLVSAWMDISGVVSNIKDIDDPMVKELVEKLTAAKDTVDEASNKLAEVTATLDYDEDRFMQTGVIALKGAQESLKEEYNCHPAFVEKKAGFRNREGIKLSEVSNTGDGYDLVFTNIPVWNDVDHTWSNPGYSELIYTEAFVPLKELFEVEALFDAYMAERNKVLQIEDEDVLVDKICDEIEYPMENTGFDLELAKRCAEQCLETDVDFYNAVCQAGYEAVVTERENPGDWEADKYDDGYYDESLNKAATRPLREWDADEWAAERDYHEDDYRYSAYDGGYDSEASVKVGKDITEFKNLLVTYDTQNYREMAADRYVDEYIDYIIDTDSLIDEWEELFEEYMKRRNEALKIEDEDELYKVALDEVYNHRDNPEVLNLLQKITSDLLFDDDFFNHFCWLAYMDNYE